MLFNSLEFALFLPVVFIIYWFFLNNNLQLQNTFLLVASYFFYAWWDWRFLFLLFGISLFNYFIGLRIDKNEANPIRKKWFIAGLIANIAVLALFKYFNFFIDSFIDLFALFGYNLPGSTLKIILPLGISFYTFLSLSYIIDVYRKNLQAEKDIGNILLSLGFFPIILAGPIQRPSTLLIRIKQARVFHYDHIVDGLRQILWGLFTKIVIADNLAPFVNDFFKNYHNYSGSTLLLGAVFFTVQIYADFSGYSNIAIGTGKLFGFNLMRNFDNPYFSRDIIEFWKKWHISLTTWFRDYIFLPLSFTLAGKINKEKPGFINKDNFIYITASIITWSLTGLWHGADYTFIVWGLINGLLLIIWHLQVKPRKRLFKNLGINKNNSVLVFSETLFTFGITVLAWVVFNSESMSHAYNYLSGIFSGSLFTIPQFEGRKDALKAILVVLIFFLIEWAGREKLHPIAALELKWRKPYRWILYYLMVLVIIIFAGKQQQFIYFQF